MTFSATDPTGGAGMQADILTLSSLGCHPVSVTTGITVQDTIGVDSMMALGADWIVDQARSILEDMQVSAFKCGLLGSAENMAAVAEIVSDYPEIPLIIDPVLASGRGDDLVDAAMIQAMIANCHIRLRPTNNFVVFTIYRWCWCRNKRDGNLTTNQNC